MSFGYAIKCKNIIKPIKDLKELSIMVNMPICFWKLNNLLRIVKGYELFKPIAFFVYQYGTVI